MAQQHGLGRGLSSLIPPKKDDKADSPFKDMVLKTMTAQGVSFPDPMAEPTQAAGPSQSAEPSQPIGSIQPDEPKRGGSLEVPIESIVPNPHQPRLHFDEEKLRELAESIREHGILQPLVVSPKGDGKYELIAGERRLQASKQAGLSTVPVVVRDVEEQQKLELAVIENVQRHNLNPIEEAKAYARLMDEFGLTQEETAMKMGKSRSAVGNAVRLLILPVEIQRALAEGKISEGHAKALLSIENPEKQRALFDLIVKSGITVREAETKAREVSVRPHTRRMVALPPELAEKAERLSNALGTRVAVKPAGKGGRIVVEYYSPEEFDGILGKILK